MRRPESTFARVIAASSLAAVALYAGIRIGDQLDQSRGSAKCAAVATKSDREAVEELFTAQPKHNSDVKDYGLHFYGNVQALIDLSGYGSDLEDGPTFSRYLNAAKELLDYYEVKIALKRPGDEYDGRAPTAKQLQTVEAQSAVMELMEGIMHLPAEYIHLTGLKKVVLTSGIKADAYATTDRWHDTVVVNLSNGPGYWEGGQDIRHELFHLVDAKICGPEGMNNDPAYETLNGTRDIYRADKDGAITYTDYFINRQERKRRMDEALKNVDVETYCRLEKQDKQEATQVVTESRYALNNVVEDKAEMGTSFYAGPYSYEIIETTKSPFYKNKFHLLMARIYHVAPNIIRYFAASRRTSPKPQPAFNCK